MKTHIALVAAMTIALAGCTTHNAAYSAGKACGADPAACSGGTTCDAQAAICTCPAGTVLCGSSCAQLETDPTNCGACGTVCDASNVCASDNGVTKCRDYRFAGCNSCPCASCGDRACCSVASSDGSIDVLCVEDACPLP